MKNTENTTVTLDLKTKRETQNYNLLLRVFQKNIVQ